MISWAGWFFMPPAYGDLIMFVPGLLAAALTVYKKEKLKSLFQFGGLSNLLLGLLLPLSAFTLYLIIASMTSTQTFGLPESAIAYNNGDTLKAWSRFLIFGIPYMLGVNLIFACGEEIGWRGYLLRKSKSAVKSFWLRSLISGAIWGVWHLPIYLLAETPVISILIFLINVCFLSICYTWIYEKKNSVWPTALAHGIHNTFFNSILPIITLTSSGNYLLMGEEGLIVSGSYGLIICIGIIAFKIKLYWGKHAK